MVEFFADTANLDELKEIVGWGVVSGCTTNPKIVSSEKGVNYEEHMKKILAMVDGPVSIEVTTNDTEEMIREARKLAKWGGNVVVKIPMGPNGLKAVKVLSREGVKTNVTACMTVMQAVLAARAGATYASLFMGRIGDCGANAFDVIKNTRRVYDSYNFETKIIVGSIRAARDIEEAALAGTHIVTVPYKFFEQLANHPKTKETIDEFLLFWEEFKKTAEV